jgi:tRNA dimethylallyltransferase
MPARINPLIVVVGTTGVGKSAFAIRLASQLRGTIINADSMQVYTNLPLITNKPSSKDFATIPHRLYDFIPPTQEYSVSQFTKEVELEINTVRQQGRIPIIVGGTNYYVQSVLWDESIIATASDVGLHARPEIPIPDSSVDPKLAEEIKTVLLRTDNRMYTVEQIDEYVANLGLYLWELLEKVDPGNVSLTRYGSEMAS